MPIDNLILIDYLNQHPQELATVSAFQEFIHTPAETTQQHHLRSAAWIIDPENLNVLLHQLPQQDWSPPNQAITSNTNSQQMIQAGTQGLNIETIQPPAPTIFHLEVQYQANQQHTPEHYRYLLYFIHICTNSRHIPANSRWFSPAELFTHRHLHSCVHTLAKKWQWLSTQEPVAMN